MEPPPSRTSHISCIEADGIATASRPLTKSVVLPSLKTCQVIENKSRLLEIDFRMGMSEDFTSGSEMFLAVFYYHGAE